MSHLGILWCADAPEMAELGLIEPLGNILSQLSQGGGAKGINIDAVSSPPVHSGFVLRSCLNLAILTPYHDHTFSIPSLSKTVLSCCSDMHWCSAYAASCKGCCQNSKRLCQLSPWLKYAKQLCQHHRVTMWCHGRGSAVTVTKQMANHSAALQQTY